MVRQSLRSAMLIAACCAFTGAGAEPTPQVEGSQGGAATSVSRAVRPATECAAPAGQADPACGNMIQVIMEYQKRVAKEQREDRSLQREESARTLESKAAKVSLDNKAIDQGMQEAREKADAAQQSAVTETVIGVAGAKPAAAAGTAAQFCRPPEVKCPDPCKLPPCE